MAMLYISGDMLGSSLLRGTTWWADQRNGATELEPDRYCILGADADIVEQKISDIDLLADNQNIDLSSLFVLYSHHGILWAEQLLGICCSASSNIAFKPRAKGTDNLYYGEELLNFTHNLM